MNRNTSEASDATIEIKTPVARTRVTNLHLLIGLGIAIAGELWSAAVWTTTQNAVAKTVDQHEIRLKDVETRGLTVEFATQKHKEDLADVARMREATNKRLDDIDKQLAAVLQELKDRPFPMPGAMRFDQRLRSP